MSSQPSKEEIIQHFQLLCNQQRQLQTKLAEIRMERGEHEIVAETLKNVPAERKCWRLVGLSFFMEKLFQIVFRRCSDRAKSERGSSSAGKPSDWPRERYDVSGAANEHQSERYLYSIFSHDAQHFFRHHKLPRKAPNHDQGPSTGRRAICSKETKCRSSRSVTYECRLIRRTIIIPNAPILDYFYFY